MKRGKLRIIAALIILQLLLSITIAYAEGDTVYINTRMLADNLEYINTITWDEDIGRTESFAVRMTGPGDAYSIVMFGDKPFGGYRISSLVSYAESIGYNVLAVVNTDFFSTHSIPIGIVIEDGVYITSSSGWTAVAFGYDGSIDFIEAPSVYISLLNNGGAEDAEGGDTEDDDAVDDETGDDETGDEGTEETGSNAGQTTGVWNLNKMRMDGGGMTLYSEAFSTVSTRTSSPGWFVRFRILEGVLSVSGTMTLEVTETLTSDGEAPIGEGYLVLSAADESGLDSEFEKFAVGDIVTLTTTCSDERLENARYATGGGDILISDGAVADSGSWSPTPETRAPRTAFGVREDGTVISYVIDGRNAAHSVGMTLHELAEELLRQGCVYAVNFDGGGSTALSVRLPGSDRATVVSRPSDGNERACSTYILFVTDAEPGGGAINLSLLNDGLILLAESSVDLTFAATDGGYVPADVPADIIVTPMEPGAIISGSSYTAGFMAGTDRLTLYSPSTGAGGIGEIFVITRPTSITARRKGLSSPLTSVKLTPGERLEFDVTATYYRREVISQAGSYSFTVTGDIGGMAEPGVFIAGESLLEKGVISISAGGRSIDILVEISGFADMDGHWAKDYAEFLLREGISNGISATMYGPSFDMKRADYILMLYRAAGEPEVSEEESYDDVLLDEYYAQALSWAKETGITDDTEDNCFDPQSPLSRQDAFTFTYRALEVLNKCYSDGTDEDLEPFPDAFEIDEYALVPTATLIALGIVEGSEGMLIPHSTLTRAQMAKVLMYVMLLEENEEKPV